MRRAVIAILVLALLSGAAFFWLTQPRRLEAAEIAAEGSGDVARGERLFWTGGCVSCHAPAKSEGEAQLRLAGGAPLVTKFGTFHAPNISPAPADGIGAWTLADFANAMQRGIAPDGSHLYPAFPYTSYARMPKEEIADLFAYLKTLPQVQGAAPANELSFPFNIRRGLGLWQAAFLDPAPVVTLPADASEAARRGQAIVEGPGHCGECHTPRLYGGLGGLDKTRWLAGAPAAEGQGNVPDITPSDDGIGDWSESDIAYYLETGFTPDFDSVGGAMVEVQKNMAKLPAEDREAIAAYLKAVPAF
ncbi:MULTISPECIES: cytochrome c [unclassified Aureimonas]|uniref:cytochrome c n=1 Tax=unclassified Aureimonas TaxID=2615206 RepID=UPI0006F72D56|nr:MULTISPECIES: cytochrome c [unclassified Aureimonas]KQT66235.1 cytochrome C [Aureimonas sp. Leaf427]KQT72424.1 cytochrome C [Aureimonas sp. Leaf460]